MPVGFQSPKKVLESTKIFFRFCKEAFAKPGEDFYDFFDASEVSKSTEIHWKYETFKISVMLLFHIAFETPKKHSLDGWYKRLFFFSSTHQLEWIQRLFCLWGGRDLIGVLCWITRDFWNPTRFGKSETSKSILIQKRFYDSSF